MGETTGHLPIGWRFCSPDPLAGSAVGKATVFLRRRAKKSADNLKSPALWTLYKKSVYRSMRKMCMGST